jgi:hypothetical protein
MKQDKMQAKVKKVMREYKSGTLHSGKGGPVVKSQKQAVAIAMSEAGMAKKKEMKEVWDKERPKELGKSKKLTPMQKSVAKQMAKKASRPYPNLVDNMRAAKK